ncbi:MAG: hypothetical protein HYU57_09160 [Micavibrio aeruginosavorus]|nr:hypothetical protein [Micavibrio aeruginosavorus]
MTVRHSAIKDFIGKGIDEAEGDSALLEKITSNQNEKKTAPQWGATANGWAQTAIIRKG